jgi:hypothetical protein
MTPLKNTFAIETPKDLVKAVLLHIESERITQAKYRVAVLIGAEAAALGGCILALQHAVQEFSVSAFPNYLSLIISDRWEVLAYWKQFLAALSESIPLVGVGLVILAFIALLFIFKNLLQNMRHISHHALITS